MAQISWMTGQEGLSALIAADEALAAEFFNKPDSYLIDAAPPAGWATTKIKAFTSLASFRAWTGPLPGWVLFDIERWAGTGTYEQQHPVETLAAAAYLAHTRKQKIVLAPAQDLCGVSGGEFSGPQPWSVTYVRKMVASACSGGDVFHCQAQAVQTDTAAYKAMLTGAYSQIQPSQTRWAGLTSMRKTSTAQQLKDCYPIAVAAGATGIWLNTHTATIGMWVELLSGIA